MATNAETEKSGTELPSLKGDKPEFRERWAGAQGDLLEEKRQTIIAVELVRTMRLVSLFSLGILALDMIFRAAVPGYPSPTWLLPIFGGAVCVPGICALLGRDGIFRKPK